MKTFIVYRKCEDIGQMVPIVKLRERRKHERGSNAADLMRLAKYLCDGAIDPTSFMIVASE